MSDTVVKGVISWTTKNEETKGVISWTAKNEETKGVDSYRQEDTIALSSCEAEFMVAIVAASQAMWLRELLAELTGMKKKKVLIHIDIKSTIALSKNYVFMEEENTSTLDSFHSRACWKQASDN